MLMPLPVKVFQDYEKELQHDVPDWLDANQGDMGKTITQVVKVLQKRHNLTNEQAGELRLCFHWELVFTQNT